jgi:hypothetical protein
MSRDSGRSSEVGEEGKAVGKGNNSQKNDKKNKKVKKGGKTQESKTTGKKR